MKLREVVLQEDLDRAISVMTVSFVKTQKESVRKELEKVYIFSCLGFGLMNVDVEEVLDCA